MNSIWLTLFWSEALQCQKGESYKGW